jgi:hypothetical protein
LHLFIREDFSLLEQEELALSHKHLSISSKKTFIYSKSFGPLGVAAFYTYFFGVWYLWWKSTKFTADKFYKHVILGERNWIYE